MPLVARIAAVFLAGLPLFAAAEISANQFGAKGDENTVNTAAIQKALDAAARSGGTVTLTPGIYLTGSLFVKSGTRLRVDKGVTIRGVQDQSAYPIMPSRIAGVEMSWPAALINVYEQADVEISGEGTIDGNGKIWWDKYWRMRREDYEPKGLRWAADYDCQRPRLIQIYKSTNVRFGKLTLMRPGFWTLHICYSDHVTVDGPIIRNNTEARGPSTDGIDIDSSTNVTVTHADIDCNDDAICLKAGRDADGLRVNKPSAKIFIRDNVIRGGAAGITIGSETSGGVHDVEVDNLTVEHGAPAGILFKSASTRGGNISGIRIHGVEMNGVARPISITMNWNPSYSYATLPAGLTSVPDYWKVLLAPVPPEKGLPHFSDVTISDVHATGAQQAFTVSAYPEAPLRDFNFSNINIAAKSAGSIQNADGWTFVKTVIQALDGSHVAVKDSRNIKGLD